MNQWLNDVYSSIVSKTFEQYFLITPGKFAGDDSLEN